jgi:hypothetical protein
MLNDIVEALPVSVAGQEIKGSPITSVATINRKTKTRVGMVGIRVLVKIDQVKAKGPVGVPAQFETLSVNESIRQVLVLISASPRFLIGPKND